MAAGDKITATLNTLTAFNTFVSITDALTANAATADTDGLKQPYKFTPTKAESKCLMLIQQVGALAAGNSTLSVAAGAGAFAAGAALSATIKKDETYVAVLDGRYKNASGDFEVEITPNAGDKCLTDNALTVAFIELP